MPSATYYPAAAVTQAPLLTSTPVCIDKAEYVTDVTLPGETHVRAGSAFYKVWQLRNAGTCTWNAEYRLVFVSGSAMTQQTALPLPEIVYPGKHVNVGVLMVAPEREGTYYSEWQMRNPAGRNFGDSVHVLANVDSAP
jgi:hypothetical protein